MVKSKVLELVRAAAYYRGLEPGGRRIRCCCCCCCCAALASSSLRSRVLIRTNDGADCNGRCDAAEAIRDVVVASPLTPPAASPPSAVADGPRAEASAATAKGADGAGSARSWRWCADAAKPTPTDITKELFVSSPPASASDPKLAALPPLVLWASAVSLSS